MNESLIDTPLFPLSKKGGLGIHFLNFTIKN